MTTYTTRYDSPLGSLLLTSDGEALTGLYLGRNTPVIAPNGAEEDALPLFLETKHQLNAYFEGTLKTFDLPLNPQGTAFQKSVWAELLKIPYGETTTYGTLASRIGNPNACRAVGLANGQNPLSLLIPCHRVIGASGKLTGYSGGLSNKERLIAFEKAYSEAESKPFFWSK